MTNLVVERINNLTSFKEIKTEWERLYKSDPNSNLYISWLWLYSLFTKASFKWVVLCVKNLDSSAYVAFYPMKYNNRGSFGFYMTREIVYAGKPIAAYSGLLCAPEFENESVQLFGDYIQTKLKWDNFRMDWTKDPRLKIFLNSFNGTRSSVKTTKGLPQLCITLPADYQTYLKVYLGKETRRKINRRARFVNKNENYRITYSTPESIDRDIDAICQQWYNRWQKSIETEWHRNVLHQHFDNGLLRLSIIWDGDIPAAALACLIDPVKKIYNAYITSYNPDYSKIAPGIVLFAESIKQAIELNYKFYDFTLGLDPYKLSFGAKEYEIKNIFIQRKRLKTVVLLTFKKLAKSVFKK